MGFAINKPLPTYKQTGLQTNDKRYLLSETINKNIIALKRLLIFTAKNKNYDSF